MYCFQDGSEVISIKHEATDIQQEQEKSAVAITFREIKAEEEVSCISLYRLLSGFSNTLGCQNTFVFCYTHYCTQYIHLNMFQTSARATETFHVLPFIATQLFPYHMFSLPFPLNCFHSTSYVCILCAFIRYVKIIPFHFNFTCLWAKHTGVATVRGVFQEEQRFWRCLCRWLVCQNILDSVCWMTFHLLRKSWHMFTQLFWSSTNSCTSVSVQLQSVFQNPWMTKETSQPVTKITDSGSLFLGKVPSLETHFISAPHWCMSVAFVVLCGLHVCT